MPYPAQLMSMRTTGFSSARLSVSTVISASFVKSSGKIFTVCCMPEAISFNRLPRLAISQNSSTECSPRSSCMANSRPIPLEAPVITTIFIVSLISAHVFLRMSNLSLFRLFTRPAALFLLPSARASFLLKASHPGRGHPSTDVLNTRLRCQLPAASA